MFKLECPFAESFSRQERAQIVSKILNANNLFVLQNKFLTIFAAVTHKTFVKSETSIF